MTLLLEKWGLGEFYRRAGFFFHDMGLIASQSKRQKTKTPRFKKKKKNHKTMSTCVVAKIPKGCDTCLLFTFPHTPWSLGSPMPWQYCSLLVFLWSSLTESLLLHWDLLGEEASLSFKMPEVRQVMVDKVNKPLPTNGRLEHGALPLRSFSVTLGRLFIPLCSPAGVKHCLKGLDNN